MNRTYVRIIQAIALAAALFGLLFTTPSLEARPAKKHKKVKIVFKAGETAAPQGELGEAIARSNVREISEPNAVVHLRGSSMDDLWKKNKSPKTALKTPLEADENPDLIEPMATKQVEASAHAKAPTEWLSERPAVDESALGAFHKSSKKHAANARLKTPVMPTTKIPATKTAAAERVSKTVSAKTATAKIETPKAIEKTAPSVVTVPPSSVVATNSDEPKAIPTRPVSHPAPTSRIYLHPYPPVVSSANSLATKVHESQPSEFVLNAAFENTTSLGRKYELETPGGRNFMMKNELFVGTTHVSGWAAKLSLDYLATSNDDASKDTREMGDPSLMIEHPSLYRDRDLNIYGQGRYFLPVAATSKALGLEHVSYSLIGDLQLMQQWAAANTVVVHYYYQPTYADSDAFTLVSDITELGLKFDVVRVGFGQRTQVESHQATAPGTAVEFYPFADFLGISNTVLEAKFYVPAFVRGLVNGAPGSPSGPAGAGFSNLQAEFVGRISF